CVKISSQSTDFFSSFASINIRRLIFYMHNVSEVTIHLYENICPNLTNYSISYSYNSLSNYSHDNLRRNQIVSLTFLCIFLPNYWVLKIGMRLIFAYNWYNFVM
ncbi:hypothetical protein L9F63_000423, partial [Diploptera punctata]